MRLDHLSYAAGPEGLGACVQRIGSRLGAAFVDGGLHPVFGTRNFILPLADGYYLEVVAELDHPAADKAPFGQAVRTRSLAGGGWLGWVAAVDDIAPIEARLGRMSVPGHRRRPDGCCLAWRQLGVHELIDDPQLPFFVRWRCDPAEHPAAGGGAIALRSVEIAGDKAGLDAYLGTASAEVFGGVPIDWQPAEDGERGLLSATFDTPRGPVRVD
ncbi:MAG: VOC family protein [Actinomycetia bacterium]|nr:VOC family protein [Actinomycetes bacterium]